MVSLYETLHFSESESELIYLYARFVNKSKYSMILNLTDQNKLGFLAYKVGMEENRSTYATKLKQNF